MPRTGPTLKELQELARTKGLTGFSKLKKADLQKLLNTGTKAPSPQSSNDVAQNLMQIMNHSKYMKDGVIYNKVWEQKSKNMFAATLVNGTSVLVVKGTMSPGLGKGGGKWSFEETCEL